MSTNSFDLRKIGHPNEMFLVAYGNKDGFCERTSDVRTEVLVANEQEKKNWIKNRFNLATLIGSVQ